MMNSIYTHSTSWQIRACPSGTEYLNLMLSKRGRDIPSCPEDKQQDKASTKPTDSHRRGVRSIHKENLLRCTNLSTLFYTFLLWMCNVFSSCLDVFWQTGICNTDRHQICSSNRSAESSIFSLEIWGWTWNKNNIQNLQKEISPPKQVLFCFCLIYFHIDNLKSFQLQNTCFIQILLNQYFYCIWLFFIFLSIFFRYNVTVNVSNGLTSISSDIYPVVIQRAVQPNRLLYSPSVLSKRSVNFTCRISSGTDVSYLWNFGDGTERDGSSTEHHVFNR